MEPTNVRDPSYFHQVVDCQWACPAHTNVPEYIRLVAEGRYAEAYLLNRETNVFPGVLGRVCDRPCEPACRRGRVEEKPVAICRLKRVAADLRGDVEAELPRAPDAKNGKRVACVGAGPASLTVASDLAPLGYTVTLFERLAAPGGLMRSNIPAFRLPASVLDEEIGYVTRMGVDLRLGSPVTSLQDLLGAGWDAVFIGSGAPRGKDLALPGRDEACDGVHVGLAWLESVAFGHARTIGERVLVIGVGNTAMDCARTARRLGGKDVKVVARKPRGFFKASPWELEDAEEERIEIVVNHAPKAFVVERGALQGMLLDRVEWELDARGAPAKARALETVFFPADDVLVAIGQEAAFPWVERDVGVEFDSHGMPVVDRRTLASTRPGVFFGGDAAFGPENIISAVEHGHQAAISIHNHCRGVPLDARPPWGMTLASTKIGPRQWGYANDYDAASRQRARHAGLADRFRELDVEVELGFSDAEAAREAARCLDCDVQTVFAERQCIECDACVDVCPLSCLTIAPNGEERELRARLSAPSTNLRLPLFASGPLAQTRRVMIKDEDLCVRCGLCAERCPTGAWDMQKFALVVGHAGAPAREGP